MAVGKRSESSLVYSTLGGRMCPDCEKPVAACVCDAAPRAAVSDGVVRVSLETKGRRGKGVTVIKGVPLDAVALADFGRQLKAACGSGGTTRLGIIEIQGDHRSMVIARLQARGWTVKRSGG